MELFDKWYNIAKIDDDVKQHNAMCLSTISEDGYPDSRYVLLKSHDLNELVFYTNLKSVKGKQIKSNNHVSLNFYWQSLGKQIRIQGIAERVDDAIADAYFATRSRGAQIGAWASQQSSKLTSREQLEKRVTEYKSKFQGQDVPRPDFWSGIRVKPMKIEFWQTRENRLHDRFEYRYIEESDHWNIARLYP